MRAMLLRRNAPIEAAPLELVDLPDPLPGPGEVRVRVTACAICRTDLHVIEGDLPAVKLPIIPGHQAVGVVDATGPGCTRLQPGDRVGIAWLRHTCGVCEFCRRGQENLCVAPRFTGYHADGGFADYALIAEEFAYRIPAAFDDAAATPLLCAGIIGYRALQRSDLPHGGRLALFGFGSSAHLVLQLARERGSAVYVVTRGEKHRQLARDLGAAWVSDTVAGMPSTVDSAILFAPVGDLVPAALSVLKPGGTLALAGIYMTPVPPLDYERHLFHERNLRSVTANTRDDGRHLLAAAAAARIVPRVTLYPLAEANRALQDLKADRINGTGVLMMRS